MESTCCFIASNADQVDFTLNSYILVTSITIVIHAGFQQAALHQAAVVLLRSVTVNLTQVLEVTLCYAFVALLLSMASRP